ncbi:maleylacetoacetate isomerase [Roseovarius sp. LXJ103]|uniref:maleylacetoacetate isomerase n=1 Tax=Roseovarius carneus TaxID=2853164 RepID=UPI000D61E05E|nr:maleylacetoacetate isomerase [Roseovarius carneus]MBZ8117728.1 maleylacetoacetate isomerase [Roseovarius carneus]PWE36499.1 maleylacetoacetate isomerase [Pelagicola sp. LXJ1103]
MKLYSYWRSTTSYRVRAALNLKGLVYDTVPIDLVAGDQRAPEYTALNAGKGVPTLVLDDGSVLTQSMAILEYIDATWPEPQLIPSDPVLRARVMAVAHTVAMDIHPVNNLRLIGQLKSRFGATPDQAKDWMCHWMNEGFTTLEAVLPGGDAFAFGDTPNIADICITAQAYNAHRWGVDLMKFPNTARIERLCLGVPAIFDAHPDNQPDAKV